MSKERRDPARAPASEAQRSRPPARAAARPPAGASGPSTEPQAGAVEPRAGTAVGTAADGPATPGPRRRSLPKRIYRWMKKLHMYTGLLSFTHFIIYGIAGLVVTFAPAHEGGAPDVAEVRTLAFDAPAGATDKAVADSVYRVLDPPLSRPVPEWALQRDEAGRLLANFHSVNAARRVTVEEDRLTVRTERTGLGTFLNRLHSMTGAYTGDDWRLDLWAGYNKFVMWALLGMTLSGLYLWLATRPRLRLAIGAAVGGNALFVLLYILTR